MKRSTWAATALALSAALVLAACSDPYGRELPPAGTVSPGEAEQIAGRLKPADQELFKRWAVRSATNQRFEGESAPYSVRSALANQTKFEAMQAEHRAAEQAKQAEEARVAQEAELARKAELDRAKATDSVIKQSFVVVGDGYDIVPVFNSYGTLAYREWRFDLKFTNRTPKVVIGVAGLVSFKDAFGKRLGTYPFQIEPRVPTGKTIDFRVTMRYDPNDAGQVEMLGTQTIFPEWLFTSLAFADGSVINSKSVSQESEPEPSRQPERSPTSI